MNCPGDAEMSLHSGRSVFVLLPSSSDRKPRSSCVTLNNATWEPTVRGLKRFMLSDFGSSEAEAPVDSFYVLNNGRLLGDDFALEPDREYTIQGRLLGGKGGFGSLLRSFGSQISKNRNQDACRDLSGRRLRNVKAEKKLKDYVEKQAEKEKEKKQKKEEKMQKLKNALNSKPKHNFDDAAYEAERKQIPDKVFSAVEEGLRVIAANPETATVTASTSKVTKVSDGTVEEVQTQTTSVTTTVPVPSTEKKRKHEDPLMNNMGSKRMKGWLGVDDDSEDSEDDAK